MNPNRFQNGFATDATLIPSPTKVIGSSEAAPRSNLFNFLWEK